MHYATFLWAVNNLWVVNFCALILEKQKHNFYLEYGYIVALQLLRLTGSNQENNKYLLMWQQLWQRVIATQDEQGRAGNVINLCHFVLLEDNDIFGRKALLHSGL